MYSVILKDKKNNIVDQAKLLSMFEVLVFLNRDDITQLRIYVVRDARI